MSTVTRTTTASPAQVWDVLCDGWIYPVFVVGASRMRAVNADWPAVGSKIHHSVGAWPALVDDDTEVAECEPPTRLALIAHGWPAGSARITFHLQAHGGGTTIDITEEVVSGPGLLVPKPVRDLPITWRNTETLRRLAMIAERRTDADE